MTPKDKVKIEVYLLPKAKEAFEAVCDNKGICLADGLRRAIELWMEENE